MNCLVCGDRGVVLAAPIVRFAVWTGADPVPAEEESAVWDYSCTVPCWVCGPLPIPVLT